MTANHARLLAVTLIIALLATGAWLGAGQYFTLDFLQQQFTGIQALVSENFLAAAAGFFALYAVLAGLSVPGTALALTLAGGAFFGIAWGTVLVSFASSLGALAACMLSRFLLRDYVEAKFPSAVDRVNTGIRKDGAYYLFGLRLVPIFPYFVINAVMGLTRLPLRTYYWVSQLGMLPATAIYVNAGTQLAQIRSARDIVSPDVALSLALLGIFPLIAKRLSNALMAWHRKRAGKQHGEHK